MELEGKELGCWCKPSPCHGDILIKLFKERQSTNQFPSRSDYQELTPELAQCNVLLKKTQSVYYPIIGGRNASHQCEGNGLLVNALSVFFSP